MTFLFCPTSCNSLAREAFENASSLITHTADMQLDSHVDDELTVVANRHLLLIVLTELLVNALHFTRKGSITMRIETADNMVNFAIEEQVCSTPSREAAPSERPSCRLKAFLKCVQFLR